MLNLVLMPYGFSLSEAGYRYSKEILLRNFDLPYCASIMLIVVLFVVLTNLECGVQAEAAEKQKIASTSATGQSQPKSGVKLSKEVNTGFLVAENIKKYYCTVWHTNRPKRTFCFTRFSLVLLHPFQWNRNECYLWILFQS
jgi:hypothetical protein